MIFVRLKNRVVTGALLGVICGGAVAEKDNMTLPETTNNSGAVESSTVQEQPENMALIITDMDKLQLELAREISIGKQASALKALADSFADLPPDAVKALLERGGERGRLQRAIEALHAQRSVETNPKLATNIASIGEQAEALHAQPSVETNSIATTDDIASIGEQAFALKALADSFADLPPDTVKALLERGGEPGYLQRAVEALHAQRSVETNPKLATDIASVGEQASALKALADSFADLPPDAVKVLLERGGKPGRLQRAVEALHAQRSVETNPKLATDIADAGEQKQTVIYTEQPLPEPKLTAENIIYIEVPKADHSGRVILRFEQSFYSVAVGESFAIRQAHFRNKRYRVIAIQYRSASEIELRLETEGRTTHLIKKI